MHHRFWGLLDSCLAAKVKFEEGRFEVYRSPIGSMALLIVLEVVLGAAIYYFGTNENVEATMGGGRHIFIVVLGFFFLALASGLLPLINSIRRGNSELVWGADSLGLFVPTTTTTFTEFQPPIVYEWSQIKRTLFVNKLIQHIDGTDISFNQLVVVLDDLNFPNNFLYRYVKLQYRMEDGAYYQLLNFPKAQKVDIVRKLRELAPSSVSIEELRQYEIR